MPVMSSPPKLQLLPPLSHSHSLFHSRVAPFHRKGEGEGEGEGEDRNTILWSLI